MAMHETSARTGNASRSRGWRPPLCCGPTCTGSLPKASIRYTKYTEILHDTTGGNLRSDVTPDKPGILVEPKWSCDMAISSTRARSDGISSMSSLAVSQIATSSSASVISICWSRSAIGCGVNSKSNSHTGEGATYRR